MSKKHFIALADALRGEKLSERCLAALCHFFAAQNPNFDERRWREYLDLGPDKRARRAAAPDLLAACKALVCHDDNPDAGTPGHIAYDVAVQMARAAIAKATGN